jgi:hypothetical protein
MEDLFAANPRNLKLPTTGPALLPVYSQNRAVVRACAPSSFTAVFPEYDDAFI